MPGSSDESARIADIVAFAKDGQTVLIVFPTVRWESNDVDQVDKVDAEKRGIYEKCIPFLRDKFLEAYGERTFAG